VILRPYPSLSSGPPAQFTPQRRASMASRSSLSGARYCGKYEAQNFGSCRRRSSPSKMVIRLHPSRIIGRDKCALAQGLQSYSSALRQRQRSHRLPAQTMCRAAAAPCSGRRARNCSPLGDRKLLTPSPYGGGSFLPNKRCTSPLRLSSPVTRIGPVNLNRYRCSRFEPAQGVSTSASVMRAAAGIANYGVILPSRPALVPIKCRAPASLSTLANDLLGSAEPR